MGWFVALAILTALALLPLGVRIEYDCDGFRAKAIIGPVRFTVLPWPKKDKKPKKSKGKSPQGTGKPQPSKGRELGQPIQAGSQLQPQEQPKEKPLPQPPQAPPKPKEKQGGSLLDFLPFVRLALNLMGDFLFRLLTFNNLYVRLVLAGEDKGNLAIQYGRTWAALGNLLPLLDKRFRIKKRDIQVGCDFEAPETRIVVNADITVALGGVVALAVRYGVRALIEFLKFKKKRKGGVNHEPETTQYAGNDHAEAT